MSEPLHAQRGGADPLRDVGRAMPFSDDAEKGILSCLLQSPEDLCNEARARGLLGQFYHPAHRLLLEEILLLEERDDAVVDLVSFSQWLIDRGAMDKVGGPGFLAELLSFVPTAAHFPYYVGIVRDKWILRRSIQIGQNIISRAYEFEEDVMESLTKGEAEMFELIDLAQAAALRQGGLEPAGVTIDRWEEHTQQAMRNRGRITGVSTGINDLDRTLHGIDDAEGELLVLAARPGQGKTAAACSFLDHWLATGIRTAYFPIEMGTNRTWDRVILGAEGIDTSKSITGMFSREEMRRMTGYAQRARQADCLWMDNSPALNTAELRHRVKMAKRKHAIRVVMVDYLGLVQPVTDQGKEQERLALKECMETLHYLKRKYNLAIILLVQLSRETDRNMGKAPVLADLAGSADIERYADHVAFIHRPCYFLPWQKLKDDAREKWAAAVRPMRSANPNFWSRGERYAEWVAPDGAFEDERELRQDYEEHALFYVRKNRRGPTPDLMVRFEPELTRFSSRTPALYTNNVDHRQAGYESKPYAGGAPAEEADPFA